MGSENSTDDSFLEGLCLGSSEDVVDWPLWMIAGPASLVLSILSTYGNLISLSILNSLRIRKSIRFYLSVLAVTNVALAQCTLWYYALAETIKPFFGEMQFFVALTVFLHPVSAFCLTMSVWMVLTVTVDRYFALAKPLQHRAYDSRSRAKCVSLLLVASAIIFNVPTAFELQLSRACDKFLPEGEPSSLMLLPTELRLSERYLFFYSTLANCAFISLGPLFFITVLSVRMLCVVYAARALRTNMEASCRKEPKKKASGESTTVMLLTVVAKFLLCNSPSLLLNLWENIGDSVELSNSALFKWCVELSNLLVTANSASDAIVYLRWKRKQTQHIAYTAVPKSLFTPEESAYLRKQYEVNRCNLSRVATLFVSKVESQLPLELESIQTTLDIMVKSIGDPTDELKLITTLNELGAKHGNRTITPAAWNHFKDHFLKEFSTSEDSKLWSRLVCLLIREFRKGQLSSHVDQRSSARHY